MTDDLKDDMMAVFKELETKEPEKKPDPVVEDKKPDPVVEDKKPEPEQKKDEAKLPDEKVSEDPAQKADEKVDPEIKADQLLIKDKAPSAWKAPLRERWAELPQEFRDEIIAREEASLKGVRQLQEKYAPLEETMAHLGDFVQEAKQAGMDPAAYIGRTMTAERNLRHQDPNVRFGQLLEIADTYGIPLRNLLNELAGKQVVPNAPPPQQQQQIPAHVNQELNDLRQRDSSRLQAEVDAFAAAPEHEFFEDVRGRMASLMEHGLATTLQDAYDQAVWADPNVRKVIQDREAKKLEQQKRQLDAAGASGADNGSTVEPKDTRKDEDLSLEDQIRKQFYASGSQRI